MTGVRVRQPDRRAGRVLLRALLACVAVMVLGPPAAAMAAELKIASPKTGSVTTDSTPTFTGEAEAEAEAGAVTLTISSGKGSKLTIHATLSGTTWEATAPSLANGTYTAKATQAGESSSVTFTVEAASPPPQVTLTYPANGSTTSTGTEPVGGLASGQLPVTVQLFSGPTIGSPAALEALTVPVAGGAWSGTFGGLGAGTYTIRAEESNSAGDVGISASATFTVITPPGPPPPAASFQWFPSFPNTGEDVSLVSSSTDAASPISSFAWALTPTSVFVPGKPVLVTSFAAPGAHVVRLRVTDGNGVSSIATETITVRSSPLILMQPFPIVRIAGSETRSGARISLLTAEAPPGARIIVRCKGHGCPVKSAQRAAVSSRSGPVPVSFRAFERSLRAGVTLEIFVFKSGQIGKYTRFVIRHGRLPLRVDTCLSATALKPLACPSS